MTAQVLCGFIPGQVSNSDFSAMSVPSGNCVPFPGCFKLGEHVLVWLAMPLYACVCAVLVVGRRAVYRGHLHLWFALCFGQLANGL